MQRLEIIILWHLAWLGIHLVALYTSKGIIINLCKLTMGWTFKGIHTHPVLGDISGHCLKR